MVRSSTLPERDLVRQQVVEHPHRLLRDDRPDAVPEADPHHDRPHRGEVHRRLRRAELRDPCQLLFHELSKVRCRAIDDFRRHGSLLARRNPGRALLLPGRTPAERARLRTRSRLATYVSGPAAPPGVPLPEQLALAEKSSRRMRSGNAAVRPEDRPGCHWWNTAVATRPSFNSTRRSMVVPRRWWSLGQRGSAFGPPEWGCGRGFVRRTRSRLMRSTSCIPPSPRGERVRAMSRADARDPRRDRLHGRCRGPGRALCGAPRPSAPCGTSGSAEERMPLPLIRALGLQKKAAALANRELGELEPRIADAIVQAADEVDRRSGGRPVPARRLADRLGHPDQHERQRGASPTAPSSCSAGSAAPRTRSTPTTTSTAASPPTTASRPRCTSPR